MTDIVHHARAQEVAAMLRRVRLRISTESALQLSIEQTLAARDVTFTREHRLSKGDRPDFLVDDDVVIEAKKRYGKRAIYLQLERYAKHDTIAAIILVTGTAMGMPATINGKPVYVVSIGQAFL